VIHLLTTIIAVIALLTSSFAVDNPEEFLQAWAERGKSSDWARLTNSEKKELLELFNTKIAERAWIWDPDTQENLRFDLGDKKVRDTIVERYRKGVLAGDDILSDYFKLKSGDDPAIIAKLGDLLWAENGPVGTPEVQTIRNDISTAIIIRDVLIGCMDVRPEVRVWGSKLNQDLNLLHMTYAVREWWLENEAALKEGRYEDVKPGSRVGVDFKEPPSKSVGEPAPAPSTVESEPASIGKSPVASVAHDRSKPSLGLIAGVFTAVVAGLGLILWRRKMRP
jgi:hypothetical protein